MTRIFNLVHVTVSNRFNPSITALNLFYQLLNSLYVEPVLTPLKPTALADVLWLAGAHDLHTAEADCYRVLIECFNSFPLNLAPTMQYCLPPGTRSPGKRRADWQPSRAASLAESPSAFMSPFRLIEWKNSHFSPVLPQTDETERNPQRSVVFSFQAQLLHWLFMILCLDTWNQYWTFLARPEDQMT